MPAQLAPPNSLAHLDYFVLRYDRETTEFELIEPHRAATYVLGNPETTRRYFCRIGLEHLGGRAMDSAQAFGASQALIKPKTGAPRAFGLDLTTADLEAGIIRKTDVDEDRRLIDGFNEEPTYIF